MTWTTRSKKPCCVCTSLGRSKKSHLTMTDHHARAMAIMLELVTLRGLVPRDLYHLFRGAGIRLDRSMLATATRPPRVPCSALVKGRPCKNKCVSGETMCICHLRAAFRAANPPAPAVRCSAMTGKGTQCKCLQYKDYGMCKRHARQQGKLPDVPADCAICYEAMTKENRFETGCNHFFHKRCLEQYGDVRSGGYVTVTRRGTRWTRAPCPMCRTPFTLRLTGPPPPPPVQA
jgi:hypothetical protein